MLALIPNLILILKFKYNQTHFEIVLSNDYKDKIMDPKKSFSRSDVMAINDRVAHGSKSAPSDSSVPQKGSHATSSTLSRAPSSPLAAKVMREIGVSNKKITEAYSLARATVIKKK